MKRVIVVFLTIAILILVGGCSQSGTYDEGYADAKADYEMDDHWLIKMASYTAQGAIHMGDESIEELSQILARFAQEQIDLISSSK